MQSYQQQPPPASSYRASYRDEYVAGLRRASTTDGDLTAFVRVMTFAWRWSAAMPWDDPTATSGQLIATNALLDPTDAEIQGVHTPTPLGLRGVSRRNRCVHRRRRAGRRDDPPTGGPARATVVALRWLIDKMLPPATAMELNTLGHKAVSVAETGLAVTAVSIRPGSSAGLTSTGTLPSVRRPQDAPTAGRDGRETPRRRGSSLVRPPSRRRSRRRVFRNWSPRPPRRP